jgi:hypothetical protein
MNALSSFGFFLFFRFIRPPVGGLKEYSREGGGQSGAEIGASMSRGCPRRRVEVEGGRVIEPKRTDGDGGSMVGGRPLCQLSTPLTCPPTTTSHSNSLPLTHNTFFFVFYSLFSPSFIKNKPERRKTPLNHVNNQKQTPTKNKDHTLPDRTTYCAKFAVSDGLRPPLGCCWF